MNCQAQKSNIPQISHSRTFSSAKKVSKQSNKPDNRKVENVRDKILGIDYGKAKVGLALADSETRIAFVYTTLPNDKNFLDNLVKIIGKESVGKIIIGIPTHVNHEEVLYDGEKLGARITKVLPEIEIEYQNEMFSTKMAQANLLEKGMKNVGKFDDSESAKIILQAWLDKE